GRSRRRDKVKMRRSKKGPRRRTLSSVSSMTTTRISFTEVVSVPAAPPLVLPKVEPEGPSDFELMEGIQAEDPDALSQLYDRYNGILKALILRVIHNEAEADDLLQEIFMEIWKQAKNFSAEKGKPLGWMVTLARRRAIDGLRKKQ